MEAHQKGYLRPATANRVDILFDTGKIVEYDSPARLLEDDSSEFSNLVREFLRRSTKVDI